MCYWLEAAAARTCVPLRSRWSLTLRTLVSWWIWSVGVVAVQPVIIFSALFCMGCRVLWCVCVIFVISHTEGSILTGSIQDIIDGMFHATGTLHFYKNIRNLH